MTETIEALRAKVVAIIFAHAFDYTAEDALIAATEILALFPPPPPGQAGDPGRAPWTDETRAACDAFEDKFDVSVVSLAHHETFVDKVEGLEEDLKSAVEVAFNRGATDWVRLNYPKDYARLIAAAPPAPVQPSGILTWVTPDNGKPAPVQPARDREAVPKQLEALAKEHRDAANMGRDEPFARSQNRGAAMAYEYAARLVADALALPAPLPGQLVRDREVVARTLWETSRLRLPAFEDLTPDDQAGFYHQADAICTLPAPLTGPAVPADETVEAMSRAHYIALGSGERDRATRATFWDNVLSERTHWIEPMRAALRVLEAAPRGGEGTDR